MVISIFKFLWEYYGITLDAGSELTHKTAKKAYSEGISLKEACVSLDFLSEEEFDKVFRPEEMA